MQRRFKVRRALVVRLFRHGVYRAEHCLFVLARPLPLGVLALLGKLAALLLKLHSAVVVEPCVLKLPVHVRYLRGKLLVLAVAVALLNLRVNGAHCVVVLALYAVELALVLLKLVFVQLKRCGAPLFGSVRKVPVAQLRKPLVVVRFGKHSHVEPPLEIRLFVVVRLLVRVCAAACPAAAAVYCNGRRAPLLGVLGEPFVAQRREPLRVLLGRYLACVAQVVELLLLLVVVALAQGGALRFKLAVALPCGGVRAVIALLRGVRAAALLDGCRSLRSALERVKGLLALLERGYLLFKPVRNRAERLVARLRVLVHHFAVEPVHVRKAALERTLEIYLAADSRHKFVLVR